MPLSGGKDPDVAEAASRGTVDPTANDEHDDAIGPPDGVSGPLDPEALDPEALDPGAEAQGRDCVSPEADSSNDSDDGQYSDREDDCDEQYSDRDDDCDGQHSDRDDELYDTYHSD